MRDSRSRLRETSCWTIAGERHAGSQSFRLAMPHSYVSFSDPRPRTTSAFDSLVMPVSPRLERIAPMDRPTIRDGQTGAAPGAGHRPTLPLGADATDPNRAGADRARQGRPLPPAARSRPWA